MLIYRRTSMLESTAQTLVNTVNCVGVMGKGLALAFKKREPEMFHAYKGICDRGALKPGLLWLWRGSSSWVLNFPTKVDWRHPSQIEWIDSGLRKFVAEYERFGIREISFPRLGCGNGGLNWEDVRPLMEHHLNPLRIPIYIHDYEKDVGLPEHLDDAARSLLNAVDDDGSFDAFLASFRRAVELVGDDMIDLTSNRPFRAQVLNESVHFDVGGTSWTFDLEELRNIWAGLLKGLVTRERAGWIVKEGGDPLMSVLSLLPQVRAVEIQRASAVGPEIALEFKPTAKAISATPKARQMELKWA